VSLGKWCPRCTREAATRSRVSGRIRAERADRHRVAVAGG
jgi:hypothetical protein